jgi:methionyl aminopeptidase
VSVKAQAKSGVVLKSPREIELMRAAGRVVREVLTRVGEMTVPGVTTAELNRVAERIIADAGAEPLFKGVQAPRARYPFPAALCTSINEEVVHGLPGSRALHDGDIISIDCGVRLNGYCGDSAVTLAVGKIQPAVRRLLDVTRGMLDLAIERMRPGIRWSEVSRAMQAHAEGHGFSVVREFVGHGIGREMHEDPKVPNYYDRFQAKTDFSLKSGMVLAVEPMVNVGTREVEYKDEDCWVVVTKDRKCAAHFEHSIAILERGCDVLTDGR